MEDEEETSAEDVIDELADEEPLLEADGAYVTQGPLGAERAESRRDHGVGCGLARCVARHRRDERLALEGHELHVRDGRRAGGARHVPQQRDLPERLPRPEAPAEDLHLAGLHDIEAVHRVPLAHDRRAGGERGGRRVAGQPYQDQFR